MSNRGRVVIAVVALLLVAGGAYFFFTSDDDDPAPGEASDREPAPANDFERWALLDERPPTAGAPEPEARGQRDDPRWAERRARWQERWRRAVEIVPLGPSEPTLTPEVIREALAPGREPLRACMQEAGGWRALRDARRAERRAAADEAGEEGDEEPRRRRRRQRGRVSFDVAPDGRVDPETVTFEPPMPEAFDHCFRAYFSAPVLEGAGADGARVELPMGGPGRRRGGASGDAGVPRRRWRDERGPRDERGGEGREREGRAPEGREPGGEERGWGGRGRNPAE